MCVAHIASDFTRVYCTAAGTIFETTDVYELGCLIFLLVSLKGTSSDVGSRSCGVSQNRKESVLVASSPFCIRGQWVIHKSRWPKFAYFYNITRLYRYLVDIYVDVDIGVIHKPCEQFWPNVCKAKCHLTGLLRQKEGSAIVCLQLHLLAWGLSDQPAFELPFS